jgi:hypothetical protein
MSHNEVDSSMTKTPGSLQADIQKLTVELTRIEQRMRTEMAPDLQVLNDFRQAVDNARLTAWSVSELVNAQWTRKDPNTVLAFLAAERLRRFQQLVKNLCSDLERRVITFQTQGVHSLLNSVNALHHRLIECFGEEGEQRAVNNAANGRLSRGGM